MHRDALLLELRDLIADKEAAIANANMQTATMDGWSCNWDAVAHENDWKIVEILNKLEGELEND